MSKTEVLKTEEGKYQGFLRWDIYGDIPCISKFVAIDEEPRHYLSDRYFLDNKNRVIGATEYTRSKKKIFGKEIRSKTYEPTNYKKILAQEVEPLSVNYHLASNLKSKYNDIKAKATATKEKTVERLYSGIDNANYIKESLGMMARDKIADTTETTKDNVSGFFNSIKDRITESNSRINSRINHNKNQIFRKAAEIKENLNQKATTFKKGINSRRSAFKNKFDDIKQVRSQNKNQTVSPIIIIITNQEDLSTVLRQVQGNSCDISQAQVISSEEKENKNIMDYISRMQNGETETFEELLNEVPIEPALNRNVKI